MALIWVSRRSIRVWDFCSIKDGLHTRHDVRKANVQRIDLGLLTGDPETKIRPWLSNVHERLIRALAEAEVDVYFIWSRGYAYFNRSIEAGAPNIRRSQYGPLSVLAGR
jgi:hypothetical protein